MRLAALGDAVVAAHAHVGFADPPSLAAAARTEEEALDAYRRVRDAIRTFVAGLPDNLEAGDAGQASDAGGSR